MNHILNLIKVNADQHYKKTIEIQRLKDNVKSYIQHYFEVFMVENKLNYPIDISEIYHNENVFFVTIYECEETTYFFDVMIVNLKHYLKESDISVELRITKLSQTDNSYPYDIE